MALSPPIPARLRRQTLCSGSASRCKPLPLVRSRAVEMSAKLVAGDRLGAGRWSRPCFGQPVYVTRLSDVR